jgi:hypothetical protein
MAVLAVGAELTVVLGPLPAGSASRFLVIPAEVSVWRVGVVFLDIFLDILLSSDF